MKFSLAIVAVASAVAVSAQSVTDLPPCALQCFVEGASGTSCQLEDIVCQCQAATQQIIAGISGPCLASACTNPADIASASVVGSAICATVPQTALASATSVLATSTSVLATSTSVLASSTSTATVVATSTSTSTAVASSSVAATSSVAALSTSTTIAVTSAAAASSAVVPVTQITDGQIQATTATVAPYTGAAAALATAGVQGLLVAAGAAVFAL